MKTSISKRLEDTLTRGFVIIALVVLALFALVVIQTFVWQMD